MPPENIEDSPPPIPRPSYRDRRLHLKSSCRSPGQALFFAIETQLRCGNWLSPRQTHSTAQLYQSRDHIEGRLGISDVLPA
jgi:hypothetical protein